MPPNEKSENQKSGLLMVNDGRFFENAEQSLQPFIIPKSMLERYYRAQWNDSYYASFRRKPIGFSRGMNAV